VYEPLIADKSLVEKHIRFIGNDEVADFFINSHYLVLPYRDATQSGPLKIAFHYNVPVIASDISSFKEEVTHGVDGYLFRTGDVDDLKNVLLHALAKHATDYERLRASQTEYVRSKYSPERVRHDFLALWGEAV
jgi:glycosyltransferase involved in cell wall biosynthesis